MTIFLSALSFSENNVNDMQQSKQLDPVVVKANEKNNLIHGLHLDFLRDDFYGKYSSLSEFLQQNTGIQIRQQGLGENANISIRGSNHKQVTFILDDQVVENAQFGGFDLNAIPLNQIERIEIIKGSYPGISQNAIGGIVKITRTSADSNLSQLHAAIGQFSQKEVGINHSQAFFGQLSLDFQIKHSANNYNTNISSPINQPNSRNKIEALENNRLEQINTRISWAPKNDQLGKLNISISKDYKKKNIPNYFHNDPKNSAYYSQSNEKLHVSNTIFTNKGISSHTVLSYQNHFDHYADLNADIAFTPQEIKYEYSTQKINQTFSYAQNNNEWLLNIRYEQQDYTDNHTLLDNSFKCLSTFSDCDTKSSRNVNQINLQHQFNFDDHIKLSTSLGYELAEYDAKEIQTAVKRNNQSFEYLQWGFNINKNKAISFSVNKANRLPSLFELYGDLGAMKGSPSLNAEEAINYSLDTSKTLNPTQNIKLEFGGSAFYRDLKNGIIVNYDTQGVGSFDNAQAADISGIEASVKLTLNDIFIKSYANFQNSNTHSNIKSLNNKKLPSIYHQSINFEIGYSMRKHTVSIQSFMDSDLYLDTANLLKGSNRNIVNSKYQYQHMMTSYQVSINNILNTYYLDQSNHQAAGRNISLNASYKF